MSNEPQYVIKNTLPPRFTCDEFEAHSRAIKERYGPGVTAPPPTPVQQRNVDYWGLAAKIDKALRSGNSVEASPLPPQERLDTSQSSDGLQANLKRWIAWHEDRGLDAPPYDPSSASYRQVFRDDLIADAVALEATRKAQIRNSIQYHPPSAEHLQVLIDYEYEQKFGDE